jgi:hypothetical protein
MHIQDFADPPGREAVGVGRLGWWHKEGHFTAMLTIAQRIRYNMKNCKAP